MRRYKYNKAGEITRSASPATLSVDVVKKIIKLNGFLSLRRFGLKSHSFSW